MSRDAHVGVVLEVEPRPQPVFAQLRNESPFRIAILADLGGRRNGDPFRPRPLRIDRDDFDAVLERIAPAVTVELHGSPITMQFSEMDDFHPDRLYSRLSIFRAMRDLRRRLDDARTFESAAREIMGDDGDDGDDANPHPRPAKDAMPGSLLDRMVDAVEGPPPPSMKRPPERERRPDELRDYIRSLVAPHIVPGEDPRRAELAERVDDAAAELMRALLHHPKLQSLEAVWRALFLMVRRIDTGPDLQLHVIDASREDLVADLSGSRALERTELHRVFVDESRGAGAPPWALIVGDGVFGPDPADAALLERLAAIAHRAGAPFIAGASPSIAGCPGFDASPEPETWTPGINAEWNAFRRSAGASWIGLVLPRFMLRLPYGHALDACESFTFEEMRTPPGHNDYLWGNGAFACAMMIAESFAESGWSMRPGTHQDLGGLPVHVYREHHEAVAKPCAESLMTERAAARLIEHGLMPLASIKDADRVRLVRFLSVASPECALSGRWQSQARA